MRRNRTERGQRDNRDRIAHNTQETSDQKLDEALALTFPASDPPAQTQPIVHIRLEAPVRGKPRAHSR